MRTVTAIELRARQLASKYKDPKMRRKAYVALLKSYITIEKIKQLMVSED